ncbi:AsmA-like C-terminal region-containing protein [Falsirhodobacter algicola]|uniref:AsmA-like C-terminal domain-containing protein n=1 Tax=Falsirhodobacter algicola TaxID=2692330 RepID=A0A8J8SKN1_9RHOB|nr:AsmA-like C-terminal region-containing protein [Falsirhodobacter algicola]QUS35533.1 hypothetical protein GR316_04145 [Falsirhodobacter algicola]
MTQQGRIVTDGTGQHRRRRRKGLIAAGAVGLLVAAGPVTLAVTGQSVPLPRAVLDMVQRQIDFTLRRAGTVGAQVTVEGVSLTLSPRFRPRVEIAGIGLADREGRPVLHLPEAALTFTRPGWRAPLPRPQAVTLRGAQIDMQRRADGSFDLALGITAGDTPIESYAQMIEEMRRALTVPLMADLRLVEIEGVAIRIRDQRAGHVWELTDGALTLRREDATLHADLSAGLAGTETGRIELTAQTDIDAGTTALSAEVSGIAASDIAAQAAPLAPLAVLDAQVAGQVHTRLDPSGDIAALEAQLDLGTGALRPRPDMRPIPFDAASLALSYDPAAQKVQLTHLNLQGPTLHLAAEGQAYLRDLEAGLPREVLAQLRLRDIALDPYGLFTEPVRFSSGMMDARLRLDPFTVDIGQVALVEGDRVLRGHGHVRADPDGWWLAFDPSLNAIRRDQLLALWPLALVPRTREWLDRNVLEGNLRNVRAAIRIAPGQEPRVSLGYSFAEGDVQVLRTLPPIEGGEGYASIHADRYAMTLRRGHVTPPEGGAVTADGSTLVVPDLRERPIRAEIDLRTDSSVTAALSLLDQPPFRFLSRAGKSADLGQGEATMRTHLSLPIIEEIEPEDVGFEVDGVIRDLVSDRLVPGKTLTAPRMVLHADPSALSVGGAGALGAVPFDARYRLPLNGGDATVSGTATLSPAAAKEFRIDLPDGLLKGEAEGKIDITLPRGAPPEMVLTSDLVGLSGQLASIGWSKPAAEAGELRVQARLGDVPEVEALHLAGGGLDAAGNVVLTADGKLDAVNLSRVRLNGWLDAPVVLTGRGEAAPAVAVTGGTVDLRRLNLPKGAGGGSGDTPVTTRLDRLQVTDDLALTGLRGDFATAGGFHGQFTGQVNGGTAVTGQVGPSAHGTAVNLQSDDAGGVLKSAGFFEKASGGALDLRLAPRAADGEYDGSVEAGGVRITDLPAAVGAVNALSGVGAADQLANGGLLFDRVTAAFRLTPGAIEVTRGAATGTSLGVTAEGVFRLTDKRFFMQGVVSPVWYLNGAGSQNGEGLFGITYTLRGTADDPQIGVNPLSLLTPGPLRDALQGAAPRLAQ